MTTAAETRTKIATIKTELAAALESHRAVADTASHAALQNDSRKIEALQKALSDTIADGAEPCPRCGTAPVGMEQPNGRGGVEYEVGCPNPACKPFTHTDGTTRYVSARGGALPRHAVEAWNEGPDEWTVMTARKREGRVTP